MTYNLRVALSGCLFLGVACADLATQVPKREVTADRTSSSDVETGSADIMVCAPGKSAVLPGGKVRLNVWSKHGVSGRWNVSGGRVSGQGSDWIWDFTDALPGIYRASLNWELADDPSRSCAVSVVVLQPDRRVVPARPPLGSKWREKEQPSEKGGKERYGAYSYILMTPPRSTAERARNTRVVEGYLGSICGLDELEQYFRRDQLNIVYLPAKVRPEEIATVSCGGKQETIRKEAERILDSYDYPRARFLLQVLGSSLRDGPYLVTSLDPLTDASASTGTYIVQDLSWVPEKAYDIISRWMDVFFSLSAQERRWDAANAKLLVFRLRAVVAVVASAVPDIEEALKRAIKLKESVAKL